MKLQRKYGVFYAKKKEIEIKNKYSYTCKVYKVS